MAADFFFHGALHLVCRAQMVNHKPNSILQFSGTAATGFRGRLGGQASSPISHCCNEMLSLDCWLEGAPSVPKSCKKCLAPASWCAMKGRLHKIGRVFFWQDSA
jgi:hypothetical protein